MAAVWAVTMVRDEMDILPYTIEHLAAEGIDGLVIADNLSTDGTWEWLQELRLDCEVVLLRDEDPAHYQGYKMTGLAHRAFDRGAEWVVPFDADELWFNAATPTPLKTTLADQPDHLDALYVVLHNHFPTSSDGDDANPFRRIVHRDPVASPLYKVIVRNRPDITLAEGNHGVIGTGLQVTIAPVEVAHFPWRSPEQFARKVINGYQALAATDLPEDVGAHWRRYGSLYEVRGVDVLHEIYDEWFHDPPIAIEISPAPWRRFRTPA